MQLRLIYLLAILFSLSSFSQRGDYEFTTIDKRTEKGWDIIKVSGEVRFLGDSITVQTEFKTYTFYVESKQQFVRTNQFIYVCREKNGNVTHLRTYQEPDCHEYIILYFYSDRKDEKYYKLDLKRC
jgi:hypothetical protein